MLVTLLGIVTEVRLVQHSNAICEHAADGARACEEAGAAHQTQRIQALCWVTTHIGNLHGATWDVGMTIAVGCGIRPTACICVPKS
jgi:hypothetical protein